MSTQLLGYRKGLVIGGGGWGLLYQQSRTPVPAFSELGRAALPCPIVKEKQLAQPTIMGELPGEKPLKTHRESRSMLPLPLSFYNP